MVLPKSMRIKGHRSFDYLYKAAMRFSGSYMLLRVAKARPSILNQQKGQLDEGQIRCAISISNKVSKKAVIRNKIRRLFHEHLRLRLSKSKCGIGYWAFITLKPNSIKEDFSTLLKECDQLLLKAGLIL